MTFLQVAKPAVVPHNTEFPFRRPCLATIFYARFLHTSSEDDRTRAKALLQDEMELHQRGPIWYDLWNSLANVIEGRGTLHAVQEAMRCVLSYWTKIARTSNNTSLTFLIRWLTLLYSKGTNTRNRVRVCAQQDMFFIRIRRQSSTSLVAPSLTLPTVLSRSTPLTSLWMPLGSPWRYSILSRRKPTATSSLWLSFRILTLCSG